MIDMFKTFKSVVYQPASTLHRYSWMIYAQEAENKTSVKTNNIELKIVHIQTVKVTCTLQHYYRQLYKYTL